MAEFITSIRTEQGNKKIDYNALANLPKSDATLSNSNEFADAKATGDAIKKVSDDLSAELDTLETGLDTFKTAINTRADEISNSVTVIKDGSDKSIQDLSDEIQALQGSVDGFFVKNENGETVMQVPLQMNENKITGLGAPEADTDATPKSYVDSKYFITTATISETWEGEDVPYTQVVKVSNILETDHPHISPVYSDTLEEAILQKEAWNMISRALAFENEVVFYCFEDKPAVAIPIQLEVHR